MPTYEYIAKISNSCSGCDYCKYGSKPFDIIQRITENTITNCPKCGSHLERIISKDSNFMSYCRGRRKDK